GRVADATRIVESLPTVRHACERGARVVCASHLGKAKGKKDPKLSLAPVAVEFAQRLGRSGRFVEDCRGPRAEAAAKALAPIGGRPLENLRFHAGEEANDPQFAAALGRLADAYVDDAFGAAHRPHASVVGLPGLMKVKGAGFLMEKEVRELS